MNNTEIKTNNSSERTYISPEIIMLRQKAYNNESEKNEIVSILKNNIMELESKDLFFQKIGNKNLIRSISRFLERKSSSFSEMIKADLMKISVGVTKEKRRKELKFFISIIYPNGIESLPLIKEEEILDYIISWVLNNNMDSLFKRFFINGNLTEISTPI